MDRTTTYGVLVAAASIALTGCFSSGSSGSNGDTQDDTPTAGTSLPEADGFAQKGPFRVGGEVRLVQLEGGDPTGEAITTEIGEYGEFTFEDIPFSGAAKLTAEGDFFREAQGNFAGEPVDLSAVVWVDEDNGVNANINLFTDMGVAAMRQALATHEAELDDDETLADAFEASRAFVQAELYEDAMDVLSDPTELTILETDDLDLLKQQESALLLLLSATIAEREDLSGALEAFRETWDAEDEQPSDEFAALWDELGAEAGERLDSMSTFLTRLEDNYGGSTPTRGADDLARTGYVYSCANGQKAGPPGVDMKTVCLGTTGKETVEPGETAYFAFPVPHSGAFRFSARVDDIIGDGGYGLEPTYTLYRGVSGALTSIDPDDGSVTDTCGRDSDPRTFTCSLGSRNYSQTQVDNDHYAIIALSNPGGDSQPAYRLQVTPRRLSEGSADAPKVIYPDRALSAYLVSENHERYTGRSGKTIGSSANRFSHYRFTLPNVGGDQTLIIEPTPCGSGVMNHDLSARLYRRGSAGDAPPWGDNDRLLGTVSGDECGLELDFEAVGQRVYYLQMENRSDLSTYMSFPSEPSGTTRRFHVRLDQ